MLSGQSITVFSKPWPNEDAGRLAARLRSLGFDGLELPVRPGYQVEPDRVEDDLPTAVAAFEHEGLGVHSVASELTEPVFSGCARAGVGMIRVQVPVSVEDGYFASRDGFARRIDDLIPLCERYGVKIGIQIHSGRFLARSTEVMELIRSYLPVHVVAVWDAGHAVLSGEDPEYGLSTCGEHLGLVNFKNYRYEGNPDEGFVAVPCAGHEGISRWSEVVCAARARGYEGPWCISAQYPAGGDVERLAAADCAALRTMLNPSA